MNSPAQLDYTKKMLKKAEDKFREETMRRNDMPGKQHEEDVSVVA